MPNSDPAAPPADNTNTPFDPDEWETTWDTQPPDDDPPPEPAWAAAAHRRSIHEQLAAAANGPVGRDALSLLAELDIETLTADAHSCAEKTRGDAAAGGQAADTAAARTILDGIMLAQRVINHAQAAQQQLIAALCRPGVAVPLDDLADLAGSDLTQTLAAAADTTAAGARVSAGTAAGCGDPRRLLTHPVWGGAMRDAAIKTAAAEIGCALHWSPITARIRCAAALEMVDELPATLAAQHRGDLDGYRAKLIAERTTPLCAAHRRRVEKRIVPHAAKATAAALRRRLDREVIAADPEAAQRRVEAAHTGRHITTRRGDDDTGIFTAVIPAADSETAYNVLDTIATQLTQAGLADGRNRAQLRADAFTDLFHTLATTGTTHTGAAHTGEPCTGAAHTGRAETGAGGCGAHATGTCTGDRPAETGAGGCGAHATGTGTGDCPAVHAASARHTCETGTDAAHTGNSTHTATGGSHTGGAARLADGTAATGVRRPICLNVYLTADTLARLDEQPGEIAGYGAITADTARALAASATTIRAIITRPIGPGGGDLTGRACHTVLDAGRTVYRPPDKTADYVTARDRTCQFPGCRTPATRCDLDHRTPFHAGGETCPHNLDALCRSHHRLKTFTTWHAHRDPHHDRLTWTSPLGHHHTTEPTHPHTDPHTDDPPPF